MPMPEPEDDWAEELPRPLFQNENSSMLKLRRKLRILEAEKLNAARDNQTPF